MIRIDHLCIAFPCWIALTLSLVMLSPVPLVHSEGRILLAGEPTPGLPTCDEFYDKWDAPGAPPGILAMAGLGREVIAAKDCIDKNNVPKACEHWSKLLVVLDKMGPPLNDNRGDIEELMRQHQCEANAAPAATPSPPDAAPGQGPASGAGPQSSPAPKSSSAPDATPDPKSNSGSEPSSAPAIGSSSATPD